MSKIIPYINPLNEYYCHIPEYIFECPGCGCYHGIWFSYRNHLDRIWTIEGDIDNPTIKPSILIKDGKGNICHSIIRNGKITYLWDTTHKLAGKTITLKDI